jgi:anti-sigma factor RsiW
MDERIYILMMEALDGVLEEAESAELTDLLLQNPDQAQAWEAMQAIDEMLRFAPPAPVPVHFAQMTVARLPNPRNRRIFLAVFYVALLLGGLTPILFGVALSSQLGGFAAGIGDTWRILQTIFAGLFTATRTIMLTQPYSASWLAVLVGVILLWVAAYRRAMNDVQLVPVLATG